MWCAADNHNDTCHTCAKEFLVLVSNFNSAVIKKILIFEGFALNFTFLQNSQFVNHKPGINTPTIYFFLFLPVVSH